MVKKKKRKCTSKINACHLEFVILKFAKSNTKGFTSFEWQRILMECRPHACMWATYGNVAGQDLCSWGRALEEFSVTYFPHQGMGSLPCSYLNLLLKNDWVGTLKWHCAKFVPRTSHLQFFPLWADMITANWWPVYQSWKCSILNKEVIFSKGALFLLILTLNRRL